MIDYETLRDEIKEDIKFVNKFAKELSHKFGIKIEKAKKLISRASEYNPTNKKEAENVIRNLLFFEQKRNKKHIKRCSIKKGDIND